MSIKFVIASPEDERRSEPEKTVRLVARKTLDGNIMIMDHDMIDIVIMPGQNKVMTFAKTNQSDVAYETQDKREVWIVSRDKSLPPDIQYNNLRELVDGLIEEVEISVGLKRPVWYCTKQGNIRIR